MLCTSYIWVAPPWQPACPPIITSLRKPVFWMQNFGRGLTGGCKMASHAALRRIDTGNRGMDTRLGFVPD